MSGLHHHDEVDAYELVLRRLDSLRHVVTRAFLVTEGSHYEIGHELSTTRATVDFWCVDDGQHDELAVQQCAEKLVADDSPLLSHAAFGGLLVTSRGPHLTTAGEVGPITIKVERHSPNVVRVTGTTGWLGDYDGQPSEFLSSLVPARSARRR